MRLPQDRILHIDTEFKDGKVNVVAEWQGELVRCKDCRWYDNRYGDVCHNPRYGDGWANYPPPYVDEDYFCKDGERKGGDDK